MPRHVVLGAQIIGGSTTVVLAGSTADPDIAWVSLRHQHGRVDAAEELARVRASYGGPLLVEPFSAGDLPAIMSYADGVLVGGAWMQDFRLLRAVARTGLPVIVQRGPTATLEEWLSAAEYCVAEGNRDVVLCETGTRTHLPHAVIDLGLLREARARSGHPVLVDVAARPELAMAALCAGADGLLLGADAGPGSVGEVRTRATILGPLIRAEKTGTVPEARAAIDRVDAALAVLLERRTALAGAVQRLKPVGGFAGRDPRREREIVAAMARHTPVLGEGRLSRIMNVIIEAGLEAAGLEAAGRAHPGQGQAGHPGCRPESVGAAG